ncbi:MCE family protein [Pseudothauera nasutitermitis]|uniref:MCE family protein n=1 Tax=Pseudothauera nasutitermitis TaxID=2565930 RepID=A0A4S4B315_9RHOO|nr:MlaD family protein [Pseudothauera nasutitermitis]THF66130.1 MCE family protein [Pseudothauera nasutitermitis]
MENRAHALAAGFFALLMGAALAAALWWFSEDRDPMRDYVLVSNGKVTGLNVQAQVRYRGIAAGKVTAVVVDPLDPRHILVSIRIREELPVTRGTRATLGYQGVTGLAFVELDDRGTDPTPLVSGDGGPPRIQLEPGLMDQVADAALHAMGRLREMSDRTAAFFDDANLERFGRVLERLESASDGVDRTFRVAPEAFAAVRDALNQENLQRLSATLENLERASADAAPTVNEARELMARLDGMAARLDQAATAATDGVLDDTLPQLNELLGGLVTTSRRLSRLIEEVESSPQMLLTGRGKRIPGPGEAGFAPPRAAQ